MQSIRIDLPVLLTLVGNIFVRMLGIGKDLLLDVAPERALPKFSDMTTRQKLMEERHDLVQKRESTLKADSNLNRPGKLFAELPSFVH